MVWYIHNILYNVSYIWSQQLAVSDEYKNSIHTQNIDELPWEIKSIGV